MEDMQKYLREIRKMLKKHGFIKADIIRYKLPWTSCISESFIRHNSRIYLIEIIRDLGEGTALALINYKNDHGKREIKSIQLADIENTLNVYDFLDNYTVV